MIRKETYDQGEFFIFKKVNSKHANNDFSFKEKIKKMYYVWNREKREWMKDKSMVTYSFKTIRKAEKFIKKYRTAGLI